MYSTPPPPWLRRNVAKKFSSLLGNCDWTTICWRKYDDILSRFDTIPECDRQTDKQTDRTAISISRISAAVLTRDKKRVFKRFLKLSELLGASRMCVGSAFHADGPNARSPNLVSSCGSREADVDDDRTHRPVRDCLGAASCTVFIR